MNLFIRNIILCSILLVAGCRAYKHNVILRLDEDIYPHGLEYQKKFAEKNYIIQINDILKIDVFTNEGEWIIDPNNELRISGKL